MNDLILTEESSITEVMNAAPEVLMQSQAIVEKAVATCNGLLVKIESEGMSDELDALCNQAIVKLNDRLAELQDRRKPVTQWFDKIRSQFTSLEAQIDQTKPDSVTAKLKVKRNAWATEKMKIQQQREEEAARKLKAENEKINLKAETEIQLRNAFINDLSSAKKMLQEVFDSTTLDNYAEHVTKIFNWNEVYTISEFNGIEVNLRAIYLDPVGIENIITNARIGKFDQWASEYKSSLRDLKLDLTDKLSGKKKELEAIAEQKRLADEAAKKAAEEKDLQKKQLMKKEAADAKAEQQRIQKEADDRRIREQQDAAEAERQQKLTAEQDAEATKQLSLTEAMFNNTVEVTAAAEEVKAVESFEIEVKNPAGWLLIAQMWHRNEGMKLTNAEIEKKTFKQMKTFCEKFFKSSGEKLDSPFIVYSPVYKVRAEK